MSASAAVIGFWEPHTSSIDFCEANYRFTPYVAELLNSITSIPIALAGVLAWATTPSPYQTSLRFVLCWLAFIAIGLGSAAFHSTLRRSAQAMDEVPMVLANLVFVFCLQRPKGRAAKLWAQGLSLSAVLLVVLYIWYEAYVVFFLMYGSVVVYLTLESAKQAFTSKDRHNCEVLQALWKFGIGLYGAGFTLWVADNLVCAQLGYGHLHILWHFLACWGTLIFVLLLMAFTADEDGYKVEFKFAWKCLVPVPFLLLSPKEQSKKDS
mmetsp:Transcript_428/g.977  ORF Transcript_428/g.977 Transcript_428/m.977 type:complete len:266 (+) Transcript_428:60-857(+)